MSDDRYSDRTGDRPLPPGTKVFEPRAKRARQAFEAQDVWAEYLEMLDGMIAEAVRHGWDDTGARLLLVTMMHNRSVGTDDSSETET